MPGRDFSFWKWIWACMNLLKNQVRVEWQDNLIYGFISKEDAKRLLIDRPCGTFLLRFSETNIEQSQKSDISGCLTLAVVEIEPDTGQKKLYHVREYLTPKDISEKRLAPVLEAMEVRDFAKPNVKKQLLRFLWPNLPFASSFGKYIQHTVKKDGEYTPGRCSIEIYLTLMHDQSQCERKCTTFDTESQRQQRSNVAEGASSSAQAVCSPAASEMLPADDTYAFVGYAQPSTLAVEPRLMATVLPQTSSAMVVKQQLFVASAQPSVSQRLSAAPSPTLADMSVLDSRALQTAADAAESLLADDFNTGPFLSEDEDGDMVIRHTRPPP